MPVNNANSVDPDQMPRSAACNLGLHCLPMSFLWDARHKRVRIQIRILYLTKIIQVLLCYFWWHVSIILFLVACIRKKK